MMAFASITITDDKIAGHVKIYYDLGGNIDQSSSAHAMIYELLSWIVGAAEKVTVEKLATDGVKND